MTDFKLDEGTRAIIREIAWTVGNEVTSQLKEEIINQIAFHASQCEASKFRNSKAWIIGVIGGTIVALFTWLLKII